MAQRLSPPQAAEGCETCFHSNACDAARACGSSIDCDGYVRCLVACFTPDCRQACADAHAAGAALFAPVQAAYANACPGECEYGGNWTCVGRVRWPPPMSTTITTTVDILDFFTGKPVQGVDVCWSNTCATCGAPGTTSATGRTDVDGSATLTLQLPANPSDPGTAISECMLYSSPTISTIWGFGGYPQTQKNFVAPTVNQTVVYTPTEVSAALGAVGVTQDASRGEIAIRVLDCMGVLAPGVQVSLDKTDSQTLVLYNGLTAAAPATESTGPDAGATNRTGTAWFFNVPLAAVDSSYEYVTVTATPIGLGRPSSRNGVPIHAGVDTEVGMLPTP
jgi:hypothetical protein